MEEFRQRFFAESETEEQILKANREKKNKPLQIAESRPMRFGKNGIEENRPVPRVPINNILFTIIIVGKVV
jgi:hypothetical protein